MGKKKPNALFDIASSNCGCHGQTESDWEKAEQFQEFLKVSHVVIFLKVCVMVLKFSMLFIVFYSSNQAYKFSTVSNLESLSTYL